MPCNMDWLRIALNDIALFCCGVSGRKLRPYQVEVARAIADSALYGRGHTFVVMFPRQSGKNELQAQIETYLLVCLSTSRNECEMVKASPTWKPQTINAMRRLERVLNRNMLTHGRWSKESGYVYRFGSARITFLSGSETANVVGATASVLLECDEAQDITTAKWDKDFAPMAASTNATRVFWGTAWTSKTLLAREKRVAEEAQRKDGKRRVFVINGDQVAREVPAYGAFLVDQVAKLGRNHPLVRTQFFSEEIDAEAGMFPTERLKLIQGSHLQAAMPEGGKYYALLIDVAGVDENVASGIEELANAGRDNTVATIVEVDLSTLPADQKGAPNYKVMARYVWTGSRHTVLYSILKSLADQWRVSYVVVDATGVGAGLASFLDKALPGKVIPFTFTQKSKSDLGWRFLGVIETGRYQESLDGGKLFYNEAKYCQSSVQEGPGKILRWGVPDGTRHELTGDLVHDDVILSSALCAILDDQEWAMTGAPLVVHRTDPLLEMDREGF